MFYCQFGSVRTMMSLGKLSQASGRMGSRTSSRTEETAKAHEAQLYTEVITFPKTISKQINDKKSFHLMHITFKQL